MKVDWTGNSESTSTAAASSSFLQSGASLRYNVPGGFTYRFVAVTALAIPRRNRDALVVDADDPVRQILRFGIAVGTPSSKLLAEYIDEPEVPPEAIGQNRDQLERLSKAVSVRRFYAAYPDKEKREEAVNKSTVDVMRFIGATLPNPPFYDVLEIVEATMEYVDRAEEQRYPDFANRLIFSESILDKDFESDQKNFSALTGEDDFDSALYQLVLFTYKIGNKTVPGKLRLFRDRPEPGLAVDRENYDLLMRRVRNCGFSNAKFVEALGPEARRAYSTKVILNEFFASRNIKLDVRSPVSGRDSWNFYFGQDKRPAPFVDFRDGSSPIKDASTTVVDIVDDTPDLVDSDELKTEDDIKLIKNDAAVLIVQEKVRYMADVFNGYADGDIDLAYAVVVTEEEAQDVIELQKEIAAAEDEEEKADLRQELLERSISQGFVFTHDSEAPLIRRPTIDDIEILEVKVPIVATGIRKMFGKNNNDTVSELLAFRVRSVSSGQQHPCMVRILFNVNDAPDSASILRLFKSDVTLMLAESGLQVQEGSVEVLHQGRESISSRLFDERTKKVVLGLDVKPRDLGVRTERDVNYADENIIIKVNDFERVPEDGIPVIDLRSSLMATYAELMDAAIDAAKADYEEEEEDADEEEEAVEVDEDGEEGVPDEAPAPPTSPQPEEPQPYTEEQVSRLWGDTSSYGYFSAKIAFFDDGRASQDVVFAVDRREALRALNSAANSGIGIVFPGQLGVSNIRPVSFADQRARNAIPLHLRYSGSQPSERASIVKLLVRPADSLYVSNEQNPGPITIFTRAVLTSFAVRSVVDDGGPNDVNHTLLRHLAPLFAHSSIALLDATVIDDFESAKRAANDEADVSALANALRSVNRTLLSGGVDRAEFARVYEQSPVIDLELPQARISNERMLRADGKPTLLARAQADFFAMKRLSNDGAPFDFVGIEVLTEYPRSDLRNSLRTEIRYVAAMPSGVGARLVANLTQREADNESSLPSVGPVWPLQLVDRISVYPLASVQALDMLVVIDPRLSPTRDLAVRTDQELLFAFQSPRDQRPFLIRVFVDRPTDDNGDPISFVGLEAMPPTVRRIATAPIRATIASALQSSGVIDGSNYSNNSLFVKSTLVATESFDEQFARYANISVAEAKASLEIAMVVDLRVGSQMYIWPGLDSVSVSALKQANESLRNFPVAPSAPSDDAAEFVEVAPGTDSRKRRRAVETEFASLKFV